MDSENPIENFAPVPDAREDDSVVSSTSAGISNDTVSDNTTTTSTEKKNASKKGKAKLQKGKIGLKEREKTEKKRKAIHPPTSEMALVAIKELKKRNGASLEAIYGYIEDHYVVDMKRMRHHLDKFLTTGVEKGILERFGESGTTGKFKIKGKQTAGKGIAMKKKQGAEKGTATKKKQIIEKAAAMIKKQIIEKATAMKKKQVAEKGFAKK